MHGFGAFLMIPIPFLSDIKIVGRLSPCMDLLDMLSNYDGEEGNLLALFREP
jgi:hypothetical protein